MRSLHGVRALLGPSSSCRLVNMAVALGILSGTLWWHGLHIGPCACPMCCAELQVDCEARKTFIEEKIIELCGRLKALESQTNTESEAVAKASIQAMKGGAHARLLEKPVLSACMLAHGISCMYMTFQNAHAHFADACLWRPGPHGNHTLGVETCGRH